MDTYRYKKVLYGYEVGFIAWSSKKLDIIEIELILIYQRRDIFKSLAPIRLTVSSVSKFRRKTPTPTQRTPIKPPFLIYHNLFWGRIKTLLEDKKCCVFSNRHPKPGKYIPILESGYLITKD